MSKIGFIFSGQGSQYVGMGKELYDNFDECKKIFDTADEVLGFSLKSLCFDGPKENLDLTENTQPAVLTISISVLELLRSKGIKAEAVAGFSLGEYSALVAAGVLSFEDAVSLVNKRGRFMQEAVPVGVGAMAAILALKKEEVLEVCASASSIGIVEAVNFNCPGQIVIAGENAAIDEAMKLAVEKGGKAIKLAVSAPFHSSMMEPASQKLKLELDKVNINKINTPILTDVTADYIKDSDNIKDILVKQAKSAVLWEDIINKMLSDGIDTFVELGPGKTLSGFVKKINRRITVLNVEDMKSLNNTLEILTKELV